jgi:hypothetical protein
MADKNGEIKIESLDLVGDPKNQKNHLYIPVVVLCPNSKLIIDNVNLENFYKGMELRSAKETEIGSYAATNMWNDSLQILDGDVTIDEFVGISTIEKIYNNANHPDHLQCWQYKDNKLDNILIKKFTGITQNFGMQVNIHFTEKHKATGIVIGPELLHIEVDEKVNKAPFFASFENANGLVLGGLDNKIPESLKMRVKAVKGSGIDSIKDNHLINLKDRVVDSPKFVYKDHVTHDAYVAYLKNRVEDTADSFTMEDFDAMARKSGLV